MSKHIFYVSVGDVQRVAMERMGRKLDSAELYQVKKKIEFGLECWEDVIGYAIDGLMESQEKSVDRA